MFTGILKVQFWLDQCKPKTKSKKKAGRKVTEVEEVN